MDVRGDMLVFFSRIWRALTEVLGRDIRANDPRMSAVLKASSAEFSLLIFAHPGDSWVF